MDDALAARMFSGPMLIQFGVLMREAFEEVDVTGPPFQVDTISDADAMMSQWNENQGHMRAIVAAYWLHVPWVCVYGPMHGSLSPADRVLVASYGFCTVLIMMVMRAYISEPSCVPAERRSQTGKDRWAMSDEVSKKFLVTLFSILSGLGEVTEAIRANVFGTLSLERFFSCVRRVCHNNGHFLHMMEMLRLALLMTTIRTRLGLSPDIEEGTKRQKHGDVLFQPLPTGYEALPMGRIRSIVLTAMIRSRVEFPSTFMELWASLNVHVLPDDELVFIESIIDLGRDRVPVMRTLRNTRIVAFGGYGCIKERAAQFQVHHADEGPVDAPTPPSPGGFLQTDPEAVPPGPLQIPFEVEPPMF